MIDITEILKYAILLVLAVCSAFVIPYLKANLGGEKFAALQKWIKVGVQAAEMIFRESGMGTTKKEYVLEFLKSKGYTVDTETINNLIESAVLELKRGKTGYAEAYTAD